jgi:hypothetical protein
VVLIAIVLAALAFAVRTRGGRALLTDYLSDRTGLPLELAGARIALPYDLVAEGVALRTNDAAGGGLRLSELRVGLTAGLRLRVKLRGVALHLIRGEDQTWSPAALADLGTLDDVREVADLLAGCPRGLILDVRDSTLRREDRAAGREDRVEGLSFRAIPVRIPGRSPWRLCELRARVVTRAPGGTGRNVVREWLCTDERRYLELTYDAAWEGEPAPSGFWARPPSPAGDEDPKP